MKRIFQMYQGLKKEGYMPYLEYKTYGGMLLLDYICNYKPEGVKSMILKGYQRGYQVPVTFQRDVRVLHERIEAIYMAIHGEKTGK